MVAKSLIPALMPLEKKLDAVASFVEFTLELTQVVAEAAGDPLQRPSSEITLASFEAGHLRVATETLFAVQLDGRAKYVEKDRQVIEVSEKLTHVVKGIPTEADAVLDDITAVKTGSPILDNYKESISRDGGKSLTNDDMRQIAQKLERVTSARHPSEVGGFSQVAVISGGKASLLEPFPDHSPADNWNPALLSVFEDVGLMNAATGIRVTGHTAAVLAVGVHLSNILQQPLDNILFYNSTFKDTTLTYSGSPMFFFDRNNIVSNCKLLVDRSVDLKSPTILKLRNDFPALSIEQANLSK